MKKWKNKKSKQLHKDQFRGSMLVLPLIVGCMIFYFVPFCMILYYSMRSSAGRNGRFVAFKNYVELMGNELFRLAYGNTIRFLVVGLPLILVLSYLIALILKARAEQYKLLKSILLFPYVMPIVGTLLLVELLFANNGTANQVLLAVGLPVQEWLESPLAFVVVLILYLWKNTGYGVILILAGLMTIPEEQ